MTYSPNSRLQQRWTKALMTLGALATVLLFALGVQAAPNTDARVVFIDVGQGDAILIRTGKGFEALIDGGRPSAGPTVVAYLRQQGINDVDVIVATHADSDHIGGLIDVLEAGDIRLSGTVVKVPKTTG